MISAPAKINLHLEVLARRADGYHDILSLFQAVSLADELRIRPRGPEGDIGVTGNFGFPMERNIITRAVTLFRRETGLYTGVEAVVLKRIPIGGGLGGGSSDAAATLRGLAVLFEADVSAGRMRDVAAELGSDVPFFLGSAAALVEGRGDRITPVQPRQDFALAAVFPDEPISTFDAYRALDESRKSFPAPGFSALELLETYRRESFEAWRFMNTFDATVFERSPRAAEARNALLGAGAQSARLTGSGSTVIGFFADKSGAEASVAKLAARGFASVVLLPLATIPAVCYNK